MGRLHFNTVTVTPAVPAGHVTGSRNMSIWWRKASDPDVEGSYTFLQTSTLSLGSLFFTPEAVLYFEDSNGGGNIIFRMQLDCRPEYFYSGPHLLTPDATEPVTTAAPALVNVVAQYDLGVAGEMSVTQALMSPNPLVAENGGGSESSGTIPSGIYNFEVTTNIDNQSLTYFIAMQRDGIDVYAQSFTGNQTIIRASVAANVGEELRFIVR